MNWLGLFCEIAMGSLGAGSLTELAFTIQNTSLPLLISLEGHLSTRGRAELEKQQMSTGTIVSICSASRSRLSSTHHTCRYEFEASPILLDKSSKKGKLVPRVSLQDGARDVVATA